MDPNIIFLLIFLVILLLLKNINSKKNNTPKINYNNFKKTNLLTNREKKQYFLLREITDELDLILFTKVRIADLIVVKDQNYSDFNRIKAKHIDFVICDQNINVVCGLEIDDSTHQRPDRVERDIFVNKLFKTCKIPLIRTYGIQNDDIFEQIDALL